jgi:putative ABC transport system permease protein
MGMGLYRFLLRLLPARFRQEYGEEMARVVAEHWEEVRREARPWARLAFWARQHAALLRAGAALLDERGRDERRGNTMEDILRDLRYAARTLLRRPGFTAVTILTLGIGIGATTAIFSAVRTVLLRELPYGNADRVVALFQTDARSGARTEGVSAANIRDVRDNAERMVAAAVAEPWSLDLVLEGRTESLRTWSVSAGFFQTLGTEALHGRTFTPDEYEAGSEKVVVLGHRAWSGRFGADPAIVGTTLTLNQEAWVVVGVLPEDFRFPDRAEAWIPRPPQTWDEPSRGANYMTGIGLLAPGASVAEAQAELDRLAASLAESHPRTNASVGMTLVPLREHLFGDVRTPLLVLFAAVAAVLLIACANVAGLMLARGAQRHREFALRGALGASVGRLFQHLTAESLLLAGAGCLVGVGLTYGGVQIIQALGPDHLPRIEDLRVDGTVLTFALVMGGLSALLAGLAPSLRLSRPDVHEALAEGGRGTLGGRRGTALRARLVVAEVAGAVVLLIGAGLLVKSFGVLMDKELGFDPRDRLVVQVFAYDYATPADQVAFVDDALRRMEAVPGVLGVALTTNVPGANDASVASIEMEIPFTVVDRSPPLEGQEPVAAITMVSPGLFEVLDIPLVAGRAFGGSDDAEAPPVIVVNEALVRREFPDVDPLGERLVVRYGRDPLPAEIVGVVADVRPLGHESEPRPEVYFPLSQMGSGSLTFVVRAAGDAGALTAPVTQAIWDANPAQSVWGSATLEGLLGDWLKHRRFNLYLLSAFAGVALVLAAVGIYGLVSFSVEQRVGELGVRRALGGRSEDILAMVLREGARLAGTGVVLGLAAAALLTRFLQGMLFGVEPTDPITFAVLAVAVLGVATLAALLPAVRAVRVDPMVALRSE